VTIEDHKKRPKLKKMDNEWGKLMRSHF